MDLPQADKPDAKKLDEVHSSDYAPYPKIDPSDVAPPPTREKWDTVATGSAQSSDSAPNAPSPNSVSWSPELTRESLPPTSQATSMPEESNPYVSPSPASSSPSTATNTMNTVRDTLGKWGKKVGEATKKAEELATNTWQHLKTGPSVTDAAMGRIAQGTKVLAEGGYEKIFRQTFETLPEEQFYESYACYLSTSAGPVMGILYMSTAKLAFCSDNPLSYKVGDQTEWSYYKELLLVLAPSYDKDLHYRMHYVIFDKQIMIVMAVIPLLQLKAVNPSASKVNPAEKYIQIVSVDNHEFWFMGFVNYGSAVKHLQEALAARGPLSA